MKEPEVISIPEVIVTTSNSKFFSEDQTIISVGKNVLPLSRQQNLGIVLSHESPALIRSYGGQGSLVSLSLHGTGSNHASVNWNGFPVNSPTTGQIDLSLIPFGFMQHVNIVNGASGALHGSGTFGGFVELTNEADWNNRFSVNVSAEAASFHTHGYFGSIQTGGERLQYHLSLLDRRSLNDFTYKDIYRFGSPEITAVHNTFKSRGIMQNLYLNAGNGHLIEAGTWFQHKMKETPPLMGSYKESNAVQIDRNVRSYLNYRKTFGRSFLLVKAAYFTDFMNYTDKNNATDEDYSVYSKIDISRIMSGIEYRHTVSPAFTAGMGGSYIFNHAVSNNYINEIREHEFALYGNLKVKMGDWIINTSARQEFYDGIDPVFQYSLGVRFKANENIILRTNFSNKFRKPTLNEKYWKPGGNPQLNPEQGWGGDLAAEIIMLQHDDATPILSLMLSGYYQGIDNWIQWIVRDSLTPVEYKKVHSRGAEAVINFRVLAGQFNISGNLNYGCNFATIKETYDDNQSLAGNQLVYIPRHVARMNLNVMYRKFTLGCYGTMTGKRETAESSDPILRLPAYGLVDILTGYDRQFGQIHAGIHFQIENLFDKQYEVIRSYAMPGRAFHVVLTLDFDKE
ncbi:MAG: TonB-dependent receptor [Bacteroidales bacterium]|nr:TonB-dependent receptor [Bacteroidales bacterium]